MFLSAYIIQVGPTVPLVNDTLSYISLILGVVSIVISIIFFFVSLSLNNKSSTILNEIKSTTAQLKEISDSYQKEILKTFMDDHNKFVQDKFKDISGKNTNEKLS